MTGVGWLVLGVAPSIAVLWLIATGHLAPRKRDHYVPPVSVPEVREWRPRPTAPDPTQDHTGAAPPKWDCMVKGHVCILSSDYCLECKMHIG